MDDQEFAAAIRAAQARARGVFQQAHGYQQQQTEGRLRAAGVGERTLDGQNITGEMSVQGGVMLASKSATPAVGADAGTRATAFQIGTVQEVRVQTDVPPTGGALAVRVYRNGLPLTSSDIAIQPGASRAFAPASAIQNGEQQPDDWYSFDITNIGADTPGGRIYVAIKVSVPVRRGGMGTT